MLEVRGTHASVADVPVMVHNISETGLLIECEASLSIDDRIDIDLPHAGIVSATLVWVSGQMFGCQFDTKLSPAALSAAQLQSAIDVETASATNAAENDPIPVGGHASNFAANLKRLRMAKGLSQASMAEHLGVSGPSISGWEKGRARPKEDRLADLANLLGVPVSQLLVDPQPDMIHDLIDSSREQIARATGVAPERVRIIVEF
ncbi:MAG: helix-turn-helix domain-containing protein [Alphaproteobacteria bacterium]|nr:helix-turn-helix domain-containing protein [Alphaproteobacteria bacterium]MBU0865502.1 helix-turn-helix domain-containing protein [Alphaproteobacteria bacterium]MBU1825963.1 helix-turn-helix domain-containing protein [Alphaproteobacteria bacterium]